MIETSTSVSSEPRFAVMLYDSARLGWVMRSEKSYRSKLRHCLTIQSLSDHEVEVVRIEDSLDCRGSVR